MELSIVHNIDLVKALNELKSFNTYLRQAKLGFFDTLSTPKGVFLFLGIECGNRTHLNASVRRTLANRQLDADCSLRFSPRGANRPSIPVPAARTSNQPRQSPPRPRGTGGNR